MIDQPLLSNTKLDRTLERRKRLKAAITGICILVLFLAAQNFVALSG